MIIICRFESLGKSVTNQEQSHSYVPINYPTSYSTRKICAKCGFETHSCIMLIFLFSMIIQKNLAKSILSIHSELRNDLLILDISQLFLDLQINFVAIQDKLLENFKTNCVSCAN